MMDMKMMDQVVWHEIAGCENDGHEIAGHKNGRPNSRTSNCHII